jgi:FtsZ-binding cell division protein ZapB
LNKNIEAFMDILEKLEQKIKKAIEKIEYLTLRVEELEGENKTLEEEQTARNQKLETLLEELDQTDFVTGELPEGEKLKDEHKDEEIHNQDEQNDNENNHVY